MLIVATLACLLFLAGTLAADRIESKAMHYACKPAASAAFLVLAGLGGSFSGPSSSYATWIAVGLVLGAIGDVALMFPSKQAFLVGLVSFLLGHVAYVVACAQIVPMGAWPSVLAIGPIVAALAILAYLWPHLGSMRGPVILYVLTIVLMVIGAFAVWHDPRGAQLLGTRRVQLLLVGALLFFVSDVSVAKLRFVKKTFFDRLWGLPAYYLGQLCIAWSIIS